MEEVPWKTASAVAAAGVRLANARRRPRQVRSVAISSAL